MSHTMMENDSQLYARGRGCAHGSIVLGKSGAQCDGAAGWARQIERLPMACMVLGPGLIIRAWNTLAGQVFGFSEAEACGRSALGLFIFDADAGKFAQTWRTLETGGAVRHSTARHRTKDGRLIACKWAASALFEPAGAALPMSAMLALVEDVTEEWRARDALAEAEARYRGIFENAVEGIFQSTPNGHYLEVNPALARMYGYGSAEELQLHVRDISAQLYVQPGRRAEFLERIDRDGQLTAFESEIFRKDGSTLWISENVRTVRNESGAVLRYEGMVEDITERKRAEASLFIADRALHELSHGVFLCDPALPDYPAIYVNPAFCELTGYSKEEVLGRNCRFLQGPDTDRAAVEILSKAIAQARSCSVEILNYRKDGTSFWNALSISPVHDAAGKLVRFIGVQTDITAVRALQEQYHRSQKMEAFGQLAGGVAHDFNNLLTVILGYSEMLLFELGEAHPLRAGLKQIEMAAQRAAGLTRQLLAFSRKQTLHPKVINLNAVLADMENMIRCLIGEGIELRIDSENTLGTVRADRGQTEQVILNLAVNARDAMPSGGRLTLQTANRTLEASAGLPAGDYISLRVSDTGTGMSEQVKARLFEPFFTTKEPGKGTGLGLATCYGIVEQSGGHIRVESRLHHGSSFEMLLPRICRKAQPSAADLHEPGSLPRGRETILLVEDETPVRDMTARLLRRLGYTVIEARNGLEARRLLAASLPGKIDLVFTDVGMPEMNGQALAAWIDATYGNTIKMIFTSGGVDLSLIEADLQGRPLLHKPAPPAEIAHCIREALREPAAGR